MPRLAHSWRRLNCHSFFQVIEAFFKGVAAGLMRGGTPIGEILNSNMQLLAFPSPKLLRPKHIKMFALSKNMATSSDSAP